MARNDNSINQSKGKNSAHAGYCFCRLLFFRSVLENSEYTVSSFVHCFFKFSNFSYFFTMKLHEMLFENILLSLHLPILFLFYYTNSGVISSCSHAYFCSLFYPYIAGVDGGKWSGSEGI